LTLDSMDSESPGVNPVIWFAGAMDGKEWEWLCQSVQCILNGDTHRGQFGRH